MGYSQGHEAAADLHAVPRAGRWLHFWAVLTFCVTFPLLLLGAEVTTNDYGMVDARGFRAPWHLAEVSWVDKGLAYVVEHSHRLVGFLVGSCIIVLTAGLLLFERRGWVRVLGVMALLGVCVQGVLGIRRVELHAIMGRNLALIHGCFAQVIVGLLASLALVTSRSWREASVHSVPDRPRLRRWSLVTVAMIFAQAVLGSLVRHRDLAWAPRAHLGMAFVVVAAAAWLIKGVLDNPQRSRPETFTAVLLGILIGLQIVLGVESWLSKFASQASLEWNGLQPSALQPKLVRSLHYVVGSLVFVSAVVVAWQWHRGLAWKPQTVHTPTGQAPGRLEGAA